MAVDRLKVQLQGGTVLLLYNAPLEPCVRSATINAMCTRKNTGQSTVPCGTPKVKGCRSDSRPSTPTACCLAAGSRKAASQQQKNTKYIGTELSMDEICIFIPAMKLFLGGWFVALCYWPSSPPTSAFISSFFSPCSCMNQDGLSIRTGLTPSSSRPSTASVAVQPH